jgi:hypothetical protein
MFRPLVGTALAVLLVACATGCGHSSSEATPTASTRSSTQADEAPSDLGPTATTPSTVQADDNQIRLTAAESARLVAWAETFRSCMLAEGIALGALEKSETQIRMALLASVDVDDLLAKTPICGDRQGGPPHRSSLQYRPGEIVLYLPKQCLLDKKVAAS